MAKTIEEVKQQLVDEFKQFQKDGLKAQEVIRFVLDAATQLVQEVKAGGVEAAEQKVMVVEAVKDIYWKINPNLPLLPEALEKPLEKWLLDLVVPPFVEFVIEVYEQKVVINPNAESQGAEG